VDRRRSARPGEAELTARVLTWLVLLALTLAPVKYLAFDAGGADVTAFRLALFAAAAVAAVLVVRDAEYRAATLALVRSRFFLAAAAFCGWIAVSGLDGYLSAPADLYERRAVVATGSLLVTVGLLPLVAVPALVRLRAGVRLDVLARVWQALLAFAFVQVVLYWLGVPVNGIDPGEPKTYPLAELFGVEHLRPYSLVGEPRDLASLAVPILLAGAVFAGRGRLTLCHGLVLGVLGILLASYTLYLALALFAVYYLLCERSSGVVSKAAAIAAVVLVVGAPLLSAATGAGGGRVLDEIEGLSAPPEPAPSSPPPTPGPVTSPPPAEPELPTSGAYNQAPDLLAEDYALDAVTGAVSLRHLVFGHGLGAFTVGVNDYYVERFGLDLVEAGLLVNSRLFPFGLLVEGGLVALALLGWVVYEALRLVRPGPLRVLAVSLLLASAVQVSVLFGLGLVLAVACGRAGRNAA
jgi:hypothetical protein